MLRDLSLLTSSTILDELDDVLARPKFGISSRDRAQLRQLLLLAADDVALFDEADAPRWVPSDPEDDHVAEAAFRTAAGVLVSADLAFREILDPPFRVMNAGQACETYRRGTPYGRTRLLSLEERRDQATRLSSETTPGWGPRRAADALLREVTQGLDYEEVEEGVRAACCDPVETAELSTELVERCGTRLVVDLRDRGNFDFASGTRYDVPEADAPVALDLIWYSSERAQIEAIEHPGIPTIADFGFADDHRHRSVLAGGLVLVLEIEGPDGEPDVRFLTPVSEPLAPTPDIRADHRASHADQTEMSVISLDPAGFSSAISAWLPGGPSAILAGTALPHDLLQASFLLADRAAHLFGLPIPPPDLLADRLPSRFHELIMRP